MNETKKDIEIISTLLNVIENAGAFDNIIAENNIFISKHLFGEINKKVLIELNIFKKSKIESIILERENSLKHFKYIRIHKNRATITKRGFEFYKQENRLHFFYKVAFFDVINSSKFSNIGLSCSKALIKFKNDEFNEFKILYDIERIKMSQEEFEKLGNLWDKWNKYFIEIEPNIPETCSISNFLNPKSIGRAGLFNIPLDLQKEFITESEKKVPENNIKDSDYLSIDNMLELHVEEIFRRNFNKFFPNYIIIDNNKHHLTSCGNYIDILAKEKNDDHYLIIELKRDLSPQKAVIQLLDYVNQICVDFICQNVKGVLLCKEIDKRTESAISALKNKMKNSDDITVMKFDISVKIK